MKYVIHMDGFGHGPWMAHVLSEPGCIWLGKQPTALTALATESISRYLSWLRANGEPGVQELSPDEIEVEVAISQEVANFGQSGAAVALFEPDLEPADDEYIGKVVRRLGYARRNLLETLAELPPEAWDWQPPGGKRTIVQNLEHIRNAQAWYLTRLFGWESAEEILAEPWPEELMANLNYIMARSVGALVNLPQALREGLFKADKPEEEWTARKMLRRFVEHELEHLGVVRATIQMWKAEQEQIAAQPAPEAL